MRWVQPQGGQPEGATRRVQGKGVREQEPVKKNQVKNEIQRNKLKLLLLGEQKIKQKNKHQYITKLSS